MSSRTIRRRHLHGGANGRDHEKLAAYEADSLNEPLLENYRHDDSYSKAYVHEHHQNIWEQQRKVRLHWRNIFSQLIAEWAKWLANVIVGSGSILARYLVVNFAGNNGLNWKNTAVSLSPLQQARLKNLHERLGVPFDANSLDHQNSLRRLWKLAYPNRDLPSLKSEVWKEMGWQGPDPSTDFRGGGFVSLENLIFFAEKHPDSFQRLLHKMDGKRAEWEYPFAVAGINISFMLVQMLDLQSGRPTSLAGIRFLDLLAEDEMAFDDLFCLAFRMMDAQWLAKRASYMDFNDVLKTTRTQLERELMLEDVSSVKDLPAYNLLRS